MVTWWCQEHVATSARVMGGDRPVAPTANRRHAASCVVQKAQRRASSGISLRHSGHGRTVSATGSPSRLAMTALVRKTLTEKPAEFDPRKYLGPARDELIKMIIRKNKEVLGSAGHAWD